MADAFDELFGNMGNVNPTGNALYWSDGVYLAELAELKMITSTNPSTRGHRKVVINCRIDAVLVEVEPPRDSEGKPMQDADGLVRGPSLRPGLVATQIVNMNKNPETAVANVKSLIIAANKLSPEKVVELDRKDRDAIAEGKPSLWLKIVRKSFDKGAAEVVGTKILVTANTIKNKAGGPFTLVTYSTPDPSQVSALRSKTTEPEESEESEESLEDLLG